MTQPTPQMLRISAIRTRVIPTLVTRMVVRRTDAFLTDVFRLAALQMVVHPVTARLPTDAQVLIIALPGSASCVQVEDLLRLFDVE